jgi:N4-gp56 family major capsid protein
VSDVTATVQKYGDFIFLNEEVNLINYDSQQDKLAEILGIQAGQSLNRLQRNVAEDSLTQILAGTGTTATVIQHTSTATGIIIRSDIQNAVNQLDRQNARKFKPLTTGSQNIGTSPIRSSYVAMAHSDVIQGLRSLTGFLESQTYAGQTELWPEEAGYLDGVRFIETTEASIDLTTGAAATGSATTNGRSTATRYDIYNTVLYGKDAIGSVGLGEEHVKESYYAGDKLPAVIVVNNKRGSAGAADPLGEISTMGWKAWHAAAVLNSNWGRVIRSAAPLLDSND